MAAKKGSCNVSRAKATMKRLGIKGFNKPKRTPSHAKKSHVVMAKDGCKTKLIRFGEQGASTAGKPKKGESEKNEEETCEFQSSSQQEYKKR